MHSRSVVTLVATGVTSVRDVDHLRRLPHTHTPADVLKALASGAGQPAGLSVEEGAVFERLAFFFAQGLPVFSMMANHPQTLYAIAH
jgi:hypothetical protein